MEWHLLLTWIAFFADWFAHRPPVACAIAAGWGTELCACPGASLWELHYRIYMFGASLPILPFLIGLSKVFPMLGELCQSSSRTLFRQGREYLTPIIWQAFGRVARDVEQGALKLLPHHESGRSSLIRKSVAPERPSGECGGKGM